MSQINSLVTISQGYASDEKYKSPNVFIHVLMRQFAAQGVTPTVVSPEPQFILTRYPSLWRRLISMPPVEDVYDGINVIRPKFISYPSRVLPLFGSTVHLSSRNFTRSVLRGYKMVQEKPQLVYGHFLYKEGAAALRLADELNVPAVVALGERSFSQYEKHFGIDRMREDLSRFSRIIAVSEEIRRKCVDEYGVENERIKAFPNATNQEIFYPRDKAESRNRLGLPKDRPIVTFVGSFTERKGPMRVLEAVKSRPDIGVVLLGNGFNMPMGDQVLYKGSVSHEEIPQWLSASNAFVLPTTAEGSCNAVIEAMACGVPVITSDIPSNREVLDSDMSVLVDPQNIGEIRNAIETVVDSPLRQEAMSKAALVKAKNHSIEDRASRILSWIGEVVDD